MKYNYTLTIKCALLMLGLFASSGSHLALADGLSPSCGTFNNDQKLFSLCKGLVSGKCGGVRQQEGRELCRAFHDRACYRASSRVDRDFCTALSENTCHNLFRYGHRIGDICRTMRRILDKS